jgi:acyl-CoA thioesterase-1
MRNPIRIEVGGAARLIDYSLRRACASLLMLTVIFSGGLFFAGCSDPEAPATQSAIAKAAKPGSTELAPHEGAPGGASEIDEPPAPPAQPVIVFLGTSLTAGYGLEESQAFPALIQNQIDTARLDYHVVNAGVSGDTSAGGRRRLAWLLRLPVSVLVLELGANDMLRGQEVEQLRANLEAILDETLAAHPQAEIVIAGMRAAPNLGRDYVEAFDSVYPALAEEYNAAFIPFLLEDVAARRNLNQADGIHPTVEGHALIAERVWKTLKPVLH